MITEIDGEPAHHTEQLVLVSLRGEAGDAVAVTYRRDGEPAQHRGHAGGAALT